MNVSFLQRHEQEMTVLNKVETQLSLAKCVLEKERGGGKGTDKLFILCFYKSLDFF